MTYNPNDCESHVSALIEQVASLTSVIEDQNKIIAQQEAKIADLTSAKDVAQEERDMLRTRIVSMEAGR